MMSRLVLTRTLLLFAALGGAVLPLACAPGAISATGGAGDGDAAGGPGSPDASGGGPGSPDGTPGNPGGNNHGLDKPGVVIYWGQNGYGGAHPGDAAHYEKPLADVCADPAYDVVILAFMTSFVSQRQPDGVPELNFAFHCETPVDAAHPFLLACADIEAAIPICQAHGKSVLISMGGASGGYGFASDAQAEAFAQTAWDLFLGGSSTLRPFGAAVLDGVDLDLEGGSTTGYTAFVKKLRTIGDAAGRHVLVTGAPQCPFPDAFLGPSAGRPLGDDAAQFDAIFVQFYNNYCNFNSRSAFDDAFTQWTGLHAAAGGGPKVYVGLPATTEAAAAASYVTADALPGLVAAVKGNPAFGGIMLWDASYDENSTAGAGTYAGLAASLVRAP